MNLVLPPYILLIPFALVALVSLFFSLVDVSHLLRYGARNAVGFMATFLYVAGAAIIVFLTWQRLPDIVWTDPMNLLSNVPKLF